MDILKSSRQLQELTSEKQEVGFNKKRKHPAVDLEIAEENVDMKIDVKDEPLELAMTGELEIFAETLSDDEKKVFNDFGIKQEEEETIIDCQEEIEKVYEEWPEEKAKKKEKSASLARRQCKKCGFMARRPVELHQHVDDSTLNCIELYEPTRKCFICFRRFLLNSKKTEHVVMDHADYVDRDCPHCIRQDIKNPVSYEAHIMQHCSKQKFLCANCGKGFHKKRLYDLHMREYDEDYWIYCDHCDYKCKDKFKIVDHVNRAHIQIKTFVCEKCSKSFTCKLMLDQHMFALHFTCEKGVYYCKKCKFCFKLRREFAKHIKSCTGEDKNPFGLRRIKRSDLDKNCEIKKFIEY